MTSKNLFSLKHMKHSVASAALLSMLMLSSFSTEAVTLKVSLVRPQDSVVDQDVKRFAAEVNKDTDSQVKMHIFAANALGDYTLVQQRVSMGTVDMAVQPASPSTDRRMQIGLLPYLATNWKTAQQIFGQGSPLRKAMSSLYAQQGITVLAAYPVYFGGISLNRGTKDPSDPSSNKGIKLRVPPIKSFQLLANTLGYIGAPIPFSEAFTAVETGVVDGVIGSGAEGYYDSFRDVTKTYIPLNTHFEIWYLIINTEMFNHLSKTDQTALKTAAMQFESRRWAHAKQDQAIYENKLAENGAKIVRVNPQKLKHIAERVRRDVWPEILKDIGEKWGKSILVQSFH